MIMSTLYRPTGTCPPPLPYICESDIREINAMLYSTLILPHPPSSCSSLAGRDKNSSHNPSEGIVG